MAREVHAGVHAVVATWPATAVRRVSAPYLREPAIAQGVFAVVLWGAPTPAMRNPVTAILPVVLLTAGFEGLRRRTAREFPQADRREFDQRTRERLARSYERVRELTTSAGGAIARRSPRVDAPARRGRRGPVGSAGPRHASSAVGAARACATPVRWTSGSFRAQKPRILGGTGAPARP